MPNHNRLPLAATFTTSSGAGGGPAGRYRSTRADSRRLRSSKVSGAKIGTGSSCRRGDRRPEVVEAVVRAGHPALGEEYRDGLAHRVDVGRGPGPTRPAPPAGRLPLFRRLDVHPGAQAPRLAAVEEDPGGPPLLRGEC